MASDDIEQGEPTEQDAILNLRTKTVCTNRWVCVFALLGACNTCCIVALSVIVVMLFGQVQLLNGQLDDDKDQISLLRQQVQDQQQGQIQKLTKQVDEQHSYTIYQLAGTFTLLTCLLTMFHMAGHLRHFHEPIIQRKIVTILWMSPIYSVTSFLSLLFPVTEGYLAIIRDFYEAYVVYTFLSFLIAVLGRGNREVVVETLARHADHLQQPTRCFRRLYDPPPETSDQAKANAVLLECQILAMQFVFLRPLTSIASFLVLTMENNAPPPQDENGSSSPANYFLSAHFIIAMIQNVSVFLAFTGLLKFYHTVREELAWLQPWSKFLAIKGIVFLTFWQGLVIAIFVNFNHPQAENGEEVDTRLSSTLGITSSQDQGSSNMYPYSNTTIAPVSGGEQVLPEDMAYSGMNGTEATFKELNTDTFNGDDETWDARAQAVFIQNVLICLEMLFFSLAHWCVFPAEEWEPDYSPRQVARPGLGIKDFAKDVRTIMGRGPKARSGAPLPLPQNPRDNDMDMGPSVDEDVLLYPDEEPHSNNMVYDKDEEDDLELI